MANDDVHAVPSSAGEAGAFAAYQELTSGLAARAEKIVHELMPGKILALYKLLDTMPELHLTPEQLAQPLPDLTDVDGATKIGRKRRRAAGTPVGVGIDEVPAQWKTHVPCNDVVRAVAEELKRETLAYTEMLGIVKVFVQLRIPKISDGNNFAASVQEETVGELSRAEDSSFSVLESFVTYYMARAKLVSRMLKFPTVEDYRNAIRELDEKQLSSLRVSLADLRDSYVVIHDMIIKNLEKILSKPSTQHMSSMY